MGVFKGLFELVRGMKITSRHLGRHAVTIQYPEEKWEMPERSRGVVVLLSDKETGELNCTMCMLCMRACPTAAIYIDAPRGEDKKRHLIEFRVDNSLCCYCGLCEEACNFSAIKLATKYEFSTWEKSDLVWDVKKLQEIGRDVPYVDTRKKKKTEKKPDKKAEDKPEKKADSKGTEDTGSGAISKPTEQAEPNPETAPTPGETSQSADSAAGDVKPGTEKPDETTTGGS